MGLGAVGHHRGRMRSPGRRVPRWVVWGAIAAAAMVAAFVFGTTFLQVYRLEREAARLEQLRGDLEEQNALLREEIKLLHTPQYVEKLAREQLGLVKPGEISLLIVQAPADPLPPRQDQPRPGPAGRFWEFLGRVFGR